MQAFRVWSLEFRVSSGSRAFNSKLETQNSKPFIVGFIWLAAALCATANPDYLPAVGPPAVRFERPAPAPVEPPVVLPPLAVIEPRPAAPSTPAAPAVPVEPTTTAEVPSTDILVTQTPPSLMMEPSSTNAPPVDNSVLAPQMFMKYFTGRPGTNGHGVSIYAPVGFVPPVPFAPPSSSATFQTTPPGKP